MDDVERLQLASSAVMAGDRFGVMACDGCSERGMIPPLDKEWFPLMLQCGLCHFQIVYNTIQQLQPLPKVGPGINTFVWSIYSEKKDRLQETQTGKPVIDASRCLENMLEIPSAQEMGKIGFARRVQYLERIFDSGNQVMESMQESLREIGIQMAADFSRAYGKGQILLSDIREEGFAQFLSSPFLRLPCPDVISPTATAYPTSLILTPYFYKRPLGFPLETSLVGYQGYIVNGYSMLTWPIDPWVLDCCGMSPIPDLRVIGNKIVGRDLARFVSVIPGIDHDFDHTEEFPSVVMKEPHYAKPWLARNGIAPWHEVENLEHRFLETSDALVAANSSKAGRRAFETFCMTGRLMVAWEDVTAARAFCGAMAAAWGGTAGIACWTQQQHRVWHRRHYRTKESPIAIILEQEAKSFQSITKDFDLLIVDATEELPEGILERLFLYTGNLIVIVSDPLFDYLEGDIELMNIFYGLLGKVDTGDIETLPPVKTPRSQKLQVLFWDAVMRLRNGRS